MPVDYLKINEESLEVEQCAEAVPARNPCIRCGRETKVHTRDHAGRPRRICTMPKCRQEQNE